MLKWALSERETNFSGLSDWVYQNTIPPEMHFMTPDLTFPHAYFPNLFCQKKVKKNRKLVPRVFFKNADTAL